MSQLVRSASLSGYDQLARSLGLNPSRMAAAAGAPRAAFDDPDLKISGEAVARLLEASARLSGRWDFGLRLAETRRLSNLGPVGLVARDQSTLRKALEVIGQFMWLHNEALTLTLVEADDLAIVGITIATAGRAVSVQAVELSLAVLFALLRSLFGPGWRPDAVLLRHPPPQDIATHVRVFGVRPEFNQSADGVVIRRADLDAPIADADPAMATQAERYVMLAASTRPRSMRDRVGELIVLLLPTGACSADRVAAHLGLARRTLYRRLAAEGAAFQDLVDERRRELILSLLSAGRPLAEVADLAGFSASSGLSHWFRRHFGRPPREFAQDQRRFAHAKDPTLDHAINAFVD